MRPHNPDESVVLCIWNDFLLYFQVLRICEYITYSLMMFLR